MQEKKADSKLNLPEAGEFPVGDELSCDVAEMMRRCEKILSYLNRNRQRDLLQWGMPSEAFSLHAEKEPFEGHIMPSSD